MIDANKAFLAMSLYNIAHAFLFQNKVAEALKEFESAVHHDPGFAAALYNIGILKFNGGDCAGAILALERAGACATEPDLVAAVAEALNRARTAEAGAEPLVSRVVPAFLLDVMRSRADLHVAKGEGDAARDLLSAVVTLRPTDGKAWTLLGQALHHCGQIDLALAALDQGIACPGNEVHGTIRKGDVLFLLGRMAEAEACQRRALALAPDDGLAWEGLGHALYHQGKFVESAAAFERSAALRPEDGRLHCYLGSALMAQKQADAAERAYRRGTELNPHHGESWEGLGHVYGWLQRYDDAVAAFSRALECDPESARFRVYIAGSLRLLGDGRAAEAMIREALARDDTLADGWEVLGHTLMDCGRVAEAATAFGKAHRLAPTPEKLSYYRAAVTRLQNQRDPMPGGKVESAHSKCSFNIRDILSFSRPFHCVDVGANPLYGEPPYQSLIDQGIVRVTGFEAEPKAFAALSKRQSPLERYFQSVIGDGSEVTFNHYKMEGMSSLFEPNLAILALFGPRQDIAPNDEQFVERCELVRAEKVKTTRLDEITGIGQVDYIKIDVQGGELAVFQGAGALMDDVLLIHAECSFLPMYVGQPLFTDVQSFLNNKGLLIHKFFEVESRPIRPANDTRYISLEHTNQGQLFWADVLFLRDFRTLRRVDKERLFGLAAVLHEIYHSYDMARHVLSVADPEVAKRYYKAMSDSLVI